MTGRRVHERYKSVIEVALVHEGKTYDCRTDNLSLGGLHLVADEQPPFGATVDLKFRVPGMKADSLCQGVVRWNRADGFGVQFGSLRPIDVWGLNQFFKPLTPMS